MLNDLSTLLRSLNEAQVSFVLVGPEAARARGAGLRSDKQPSAIDVIPDDRTANLSLLSMMLTTKLGARSRLSFAGTELPLVLDAATFRRLPVLPLTTNYGDITVLMPAMGGRIPYPDLLEESSELEVRGVVVDVATVAALLDGLASCAGPAEKGLLADLRRLDDLARSTPHTHHPASRAGTREEDLLELELSIQGVLAKSQQPATVREIFAGLRVTSVRASYRDVRRVAESMTTRGLLQRRRRGAANTYRLNDDYETDTARAVARLLAATKDPATTAHRALQLLALVENQDSEARERGTPHL